MAAGAAGLYWLNNTTYFEDPSPRCRGVINFLAGDPNTPTYGWHIEKWVPAVALIGEDGLAKPVTEKITCLVNAANKDDLADELVTFKKFADIARNAGISTSTCSNVFLWIAPNNGQYIISYVHNINYELLEPVTESCGHIAKNQVRVRIEILREPFWEGSEFFVDYATATPSAAASVEIDYRYNSDDISGDVGTRMVNIDFSPGAIGGEIGRLWCGLRTERTITDIDHFFNIWELEDGTLNDTPPSGDSGITVDNTTDINGASPGSFNGKFVKLIPNDLTWDDTWHEVVNIAVYDVVGDTRLSRDQFGIFKWLLRAKVTSGEWETRLKFGYVDMDDDDYVENSITTVDNTNWDYFDMGQRKIPFRDSRTIHPAITFTLVGTMAESFTIQVWARRTSGTGNLYLDCLCPIPLDEGYFMTWDCGAQKTAESTESIVYCESGYRTADCLIYNSSPVLIQKAVAFNANDFNFAPNCDGRLIVVYARNDQSVLTDELSYRGYYGTRYLSFREDEP